MGAHHSFCLVCLAYNIFFSSSFFASSQTINLFLLASLPHSFFIFCSFFMWKVFCSKDTCKNKIYVEHWTDVKRCLKHKILFRLHMLSSFHSSIHLAQNLFSVFFIIIGSSRRILSRHGYPFAIDILHTFRSPSKKWLNGTQFSIKL